MGEDWQKIFTCERRLTGDYYSGHTSHLGGDSVTSIYVTKDIFVSPFPAPDTLNTNLWCRSGWWCHLPGKNWWAGHPQHFHWDRETNSLSGRDRKVETKYNTQYGWVSYTAVVGNSGSSGNRPFFSSKNVKMWLRILLYSFWAMAQGSKKFSFY